MNMEFLNIIFKDITSLFNILFLIFALMAIVGVVLVKGCHVPFSLVLLFFGLVICIFCCIVIYAVNMTTKTFVDELQTTETNFIMKNSGYQNEENKTENQNLPFKVD